MEGERLRRRRKSAPGMPLRVQAMEGERLRRRRKSASGMPLHVSGRDIDHTHPLATGHAQRYSGKASCVTRKPPYLRHLRCSCNCTLGAPCTKLFGSNFSHLDGVIILHARMAWSTMMNRQ